MFNSIFNKNKSDLEQAFSKTRLNTSITPFLEYLAGTDFYYAPASRSYHENYPGGLYEHCKSMFNELWRFKGVMKKDWSIEDLLLISFGHDICKVGLYIPNIDNEGYVTYSYNPLSDPKMHAIKSLEILYNIIPNDLNKRVSESIAFHMGLWTEDINDVSNLILKKQSEDDLVFFTHCADMVSSRMGRVARSIRCIGEDVEITY